METLLPSLLEDILKIDKYINSTSSADLKVAQLNYGKSGVVEHTRRDGNA